MARVAGITVQERTSRKNFKLVIDYKKHPELVEEILRRNNMEDLTSPYDPKFVAKIKESEKEITEGKTHKVDLDNLWK